MRRVETDWRLAGLVLLAFGGAAYLHAQDGATVGGEQLDPSTYGPSYVETLDAAIQRDQNLMGPQPPDARERNGQHGAWMVPARGATYATHSGMHNIVNKWGDTRMGIGFPTAVDVDGAWFAGQAGPGAWTAAVRAIGYRAGQVAQQTDWFRQIDAAPQWFAMDLHDVDRIEIVALPRLNGAAWYSLDDLTYVTHANGAEQRIVVDFEDLPYDTKLTGTQYAGLTWEKGTGDFTQDEGVHAPLAPAGTDRGVVDTTVSGTLRTSAPTLFGSFRGVIKGDAGSQSYPPDTHGAVGPRHFVETVNRNFAIYNKRTGALISDILLGSFLPGSNGDPRVLFDPSSGRWVVICSDFNANARVYLAVSLTDDPTGAWFKTSFVTAQGADAGRWPDYPTLGVDGNGVYVAAYMVGSTDLMTIFAINKAPLIAPTPSLGTITAFRGLTWEGAIQPAITIGAAPGEYCVSWRTSTSLRLRRINPPLTAPTLTEVGNFTVNAFGDPPLATAQGSSTPLDTVDKRVMMALYRDGSLWACHTINVNSRAACRWYQLNPVAPLTVVQWGNVADATLHYFFPSLAVNSRGDVVMGFTGSNSSQYPGAYATGRRASDPAGQMGAPFRYKAGLGAQNNIDGYGRNRWGDYSLTTVDPIDDTTFWTLQEYGESSNNWGTYTGRFGYNLIGDLNCDGVIDFSDITAFVLSLSDPAGYAVQYPNCDRTNGDCNGDGVVNFDDINPFVALISG